MKALAADDPRVIGEYRLRARLGAGGMGRVYLGLSPGGRAVAVKVVRPDLATDTEFLRRFGQEVAAARAVSGIYTAPVVASGLNERPPWLATAFVPGPSLEQIVTEHGPLPEQALWPLLAGLVEALQAIHGCGVVHRDLKPANVLLAADGPRVIDFGISRAADGTALTATGVVFGTPGFISPEQAEGRPAGPASDVFALGCVIAYAATGACPFGQGSAASVLYRVVHSEPALDVGPGLPPRLREVVGRCLAKDPAARPTPQALTAAIAGRAGATGPFEVTFWPRPVADLIGAYQARLEIQTKAAQLSGYGASGPGRGASGYGGAQPAPPAPRGYLPADAVPSAGARHVPNALNGGFPLGSGPARYLGPVPASVINAVRLMYAGAVYALIYGIVFAAAIDVYTKRHPALSARYHLAGLTIAVVFLSLVELGLWLGVARACKRGRNAARIAGTAMFGLYTVVTLAALGDVHPGIGITKALAVIGWVIACAAVVLLWQPPSSAFFRNSR